MRYFTVKQLREELDSYPDDWIMIIDDNRLPSSVHVEDVYTLDDGEVSIKLSS